MHLWNIYYYIIQHSEKKIDSIFFISNTKQYLLCL